MNTITNTSESAHFKGAENNLSDSDKFKSERED